MNAIKSRFYQLRFGIVSLLLLSLISQATLACEDRIFTNGFETLFQVQVDVNDLDNDSDGRTLIVQLNNSESLSVSSNGISHFCTGLAINSIYSVTVLSQPQSGNTCTLSNNSGIINSDTIITVQCGQSRWDEMDWDEGNWN